MLAQSQPRFLSKYIHVILYAWTIVSDWQSFIAYFTEKWKELYLCGVVLQAESFQPKPSFPRDEQKKHFITVGDQFRSMTFVHMQYFNHLATHIHVYTQMYCVLVSTSSVSVAVTSLVPRLFPAPVFDHLQYGNEAVIQSSIAVISGCQLDALFYSSGPICDIWCTSWMYNFLHCEWVFQSGPQLVSLTFILSNSQLHLLLHPIVELYNHQVIIDHPNWWVGVFETDGVSRLP